MFSLDPPTEDSNVDQSVAAQDENAVNVVGVAGESQAARKRKKKKRRKKSTVNAASLETPVSQHDTETGVLSDIVNTKPESDTVNVTVEALKAENEAHVGYIKSLNAQVKALQNEKEKLEVKQGLFKMEATERFAKCKAELEAAKERCECTEKRIQQKDKELERAKLEIGELKSCGGPIEIQNMSAEKEKRLKDITEILNTTEAELVATKKMRDELRNQLEHYEEKLTVNAFFNGKAQPVVWQLAHYCMAPTCGRAFTLFTRRHHCRECGLSICSTHSIKRKGDASSLLVCTMCMEK
eukprot:CFRG3314T1